MIFSGGAPFCNLDNTAIAGKMNVRPLYPIGAFYFYFREGTVMQGLRLGMRRYKLYLGGDIYYEP